MFRRTIIPTKERPKRCCPNLFGCQQCRHALREWKRYETARKRLLEKPTSHDRILCQFSLLAMMMLIAFGGLMVMQENHEAAFKCLCGSLIWALSAFIFDHHAKEEEGSND
jgi:hypothetical protein